MGCLQSKEKKTLINVGVSSHMENKDILNVYDNTPSVNKRIFPELVGKTKDEVIYYFQLNYPHLIIKFNEETLNPYLTHEIYEFYDILITIDKGIVTEIPSY